MSQVVVQREKAPEIAAQRLGDLYICASVPTRSGVNTEYVNRVVLGNMLLERAP